MIGEGTHGDGEGHGLAEAELAELPVVGRIEGERRGRTTAPKILCHQWQAA